ncbi:unnamed protein product [Prorocentrum cordatum]|uniref:Uncharacterized protein n=1 Tax=Prorocentrum cordatum TaxID=2364126 RepID=A0ABN9PX97_9DINO|nr:unnamed protein product [Polarella glacialis]
MRRWRHGAENFAAAEPHIYNTAMPWLARADNERAMQSCCSTDSRLGGERGRTWRREEEEEEEEEEEGADRAGPQGGRASHSSAGPAKRGPRGEGREPEGPARAAGRSRAPSVRRRVLLLRAPSKSPVQTVRPSSGRRKNSGRFSTSQLHLDLKRASDI